MTLDERVIRTFNVHGEIMKIHTRALCAHNECLAMNAENSYAVCVGYTPPYSDKHYNEVMQRWGLVDGEGNPVKI
jgi:hypothetical protein